MPIDPKWVPISLSEVSLVMPETKIVSSWTIKSPLRSLGNPPLPRQRKQ